MKEQIGLKAMLSKVKANLPYWSEKMPEVPDLLFDTLKQVRQLPQQQQQWLEALQQQQHKQHRSRRYQLLGATLVIVAVLLPLYPISHAYAAGAGIAGALCWLRSWLIR